MALVDWKCPSCGREIRVDWSLRDCYCNACGKRVEIGSAAGTGAAERDGGLADRTCPKCGREIRIDPARSDCYCNACGARIESRETPAGAAGKADAGWKSGSSGSADVQPETPSQGWRNAGSGKSKPVAAASSAQREKSPIDPSPKPPAASSAKPSQGGSEPPHAGTEKPTAGKLFGAFLLCWFVVGSVCAVGSVIGILGARSALDGSSLGDIYGYARGYSTGGIASLVLGIIAATRYSKTGRLGSAVGFAFFAGVVLAVFVVLAFPMLFQMRWG